MDYTRRDVGKLGLAGAMALLVKSEPWLFAAAKPNSKWAGVQVGMNVPYNFGTGNFTSGDEILQKCLTLNCSADGCGRDAVMRMIPLSVNLLELLSRLKSVCLSFVMSACIVPRSAGHSISSVLPFLSISG